MARSRQPATPVPAPGLPGLTRPRPEVTARLEERIDKGKELQARQIQSPSDMEVYKNDARKWQEYNSDLLRQLFSNEVIKHEYGRAMLPSRVAHDEMDAFRILHDERMGNQITKLESIVERLGLYQEAVCVPELTISTEAGSKKPSDVFVVHGHDEGAREAVARFIQTLGFKPIILHETANEGRTVIEKVETHRDVGFAVVLLTPDDEGCRKGGTPGPRARQNVVLELGYFIGRLGRNRVCALKRGELEIPSDFGGVVYEPFDASGGWKLALGRELRAAGFEIDWNKVHE
jgi:predicted nucleotide-binding protein